MTRILLHLIQAQIYVFVIFNSQPSSTSVLNEKYSLTLFSLFVYVVETEVKSSILIGEIFERPRLSITVNESALRSVPNPRMICQVALRARTKSGKVLGYKGINVDTLLR